jgi:23S rRNA (pseudouridine1915-N3)-methyltransferase
VEEVVVPEEGRGDAAHQQRLEGERLLGALRAGERVVALDERGKAFGSEDFAGQLGRWRDQGVRQVDAVRQRADLVLSLSAMTFPHQLVRLLLAEQLYRAQQILAGTGYHH